MIKKILAKEIITSAPLTFSLWGVFLESTIKLPIKKIDIYIQKWAMVQSDSFKEKDWEDVQFKKLKKTLCHANKNIVFWRSLFKKINFNPKKMSRIEDIQKIPILTRSGIKKIKQEDLLGLNIDRQRYSQASTSGSTGEPLTFFQDKRDLFRRKINNFQEFRYIGANTDDSILIVSLTTHKDLEDFNIRIKSLDFEDEGKRHSKIYPLIVSAQPRLLIATPSDLERILFFCKKDGFRPRIDRVCYMGEELNQKIKEEIKSFFGSIVYSSYGTCECSLIGIQCKSEGRHLAPWMNFVEVVEGRIVVTTFENEVMPFIRYEIGDEGSILDEKCKCGRSSKLLTFKGRSAGLIKLNDNSIFHMLYVVQYLAKTFSEKITKFQFEQKSPQILIMRYVLNSKDDQVLVEGELKKYFETVLKNKIEVVFVNVEYIHPNFSRKTPLFIKNYEPDFL